MVVEQLVSSLKFQSNVSKYLIGLIPRSKGNWLLGQALVKLLPYRYTLLTLTFTLKTGKPIQIHLNLSDPTQFSMVKNDRFDLSTASIISSLLKEGDAFIDVGANWGYFTSIACQVVGSAGLVLAIEPNARAFRKLLETSRRNILTNVIPLNYAAYDSVGRTVSICQPFYKQTTSSYVREEEPLRKNWDAVTTTLDGITSRVRPQVRLVKVDTEGAELLVMKGAQSLLQECKPWVILEVSKYSQRFGYQMKELYDFMASLGYTHAYEINDHPGGHRLSGPLQNTVEGQILFIDRQSDVPLMSAERLQNMSSNEVFQ